MRDVMVVGVGMTKFGRFPQMQIDELGRDAVLDALDDASADIRDVEMVYCGSLYDSNVLGQRVLKQVGMTGVPVINVSNACATGSTAVREAYLAIASGRCDMALAVGAEQMGKKGLLGVGEADPYYNPEGTLGTYLMPGIFAELGVRHMTEYGTTEEQFAKIAVKNHKYSIYNPRSQYQVVYSLDEIMNSRMICWPNRIYMCCPTGDGAAAVLLCSAEKAKQYTTKPVKVAASAMVTTRLSQQGLGFVDPCPMTKEAAQLAYQQAGISPKDLDVVELHDCFATAEMLHYENLMLCGPGEAGRMIDEGRTELGGDVPVNLSGGLLSKGHPIGATGAAQIAELTWQLRGTAQTPDRQVSNAKVALGHVQGGFDVCTIHVLTV